MELIHANRESLKRVDAFAAYPGHYGHKVQDTIEEVFILMLQALAERHLKPGFERYEWAILLLGDQPNASPEPLKNSRLSNLTNIRNPESVLLLWCNSSSWFTSEIRSSQWFKSILIRNWYARILSGHLCP